MQDTLDPNKPQVFEDDDSEDTNDAELTPQISPENLSMLKVYAFFLLTFQSTFDTALSVLLSFMVTFFNMVTDTCSETDALKTFTKELPRSILMARKLIGGNRDKFRKYKCCPSCFSIYPWENDSQKQQQCSHIEFPDHPQEWRRKSCGEQLMKLVKTPNQKTLFYPRLVYCYKSVIESLQELLLRPHFVNKCELWRERKHDAGMYNDIHDGKVWEDFSEYKGKPFLSLPFNFGFSLNIDWFQPFKHTKHAEGAAYLTILNLPREERYLQENIILMGVIPGPKEPSLTMNGLLKPFVEEMLKLWNGVIMKTSQGLHALVRGALLCCNCDVPAARKVCGFLSHSAYRGCSKCLLPFPTAAFGEKADYTNMDCSQWTPRTVKDHIDAGNEHRKCTTQAARDIVEKNSGVRYSVLNQLPYFDPPRMCVIDPMHNLLLGTAKHMVAVWKTLGVLTDKDLIEIQRKVDSFTTPNDLGRIPSKIASNFSGFTAEQWKNWTIYFSPYCLKPVLPPQHYHCWHLFVKACYYICRRSISMQDITEADRLLMEFYRQFVSLYGQEHCTPNLHLHGHLYECMKDYGPVYAFWLFSFERCNGILGGYHTNSRNISIQLMRKFLDSKSYAPCNWPIAYKDDFYPVLEKFRYHKGSLKQSSFEDRDTVNDEVCGMPPIQEDVFNHIQLSTIATLLSSCYPKDSHTVLMLYSRAKAIRTQQVVIGSAGCRHSNASLVLIDDPNIANTPTLCEIQYFAQCRLHPLTSSSGDVSQPKTIWVAAVKVFMEHPCKHWYGHPIQVWCTVPNSPYTHFVPVSSILSRVVFTKSKVNFDSIIMEDTVYIISPLVSKCL